MDVTELPSDAAQGVSNAAKKGGNALTNTLYFDIVR